MVQTWKTSQPEETSREACGSRYKRVVRRLPVRDSDRAECQVCEHVTESWNGTGVASYRLIEAKPWPRPQ